jgi:hypothetical protein
MWSGGVGSLASFPVLFILPLGSALLLSDRQFALWSVLNSLVTVSVALDFGGSAYVLATTPTASHLTRTLWRGIVMSSCGTLLVGAVALVVWVPYSRTPVGHIWSFWAGESAVMILILAGIFRSVAVVVACMMLELNELRARNRVLIGQAVLAVAIGIGLAALTHSAASLPWGWAAASLGSCVYALRAVSAQIRTAELSSDRNAKVREQTGTSDEGRFGTRTFATWRTVAAVLAALALQGDRWVVGALAGPTILAQYEIAWRFAAVPRSVANSLGIAVVGVARTGGAARQRHLLGESTKIFAVCLGALGAGVVVFCLAVRFFSHHIQIEFLLVLLVGLSLNSLTSPAVNVGLGRGRAYVDVPWWSIALVLMAGLWIISWDLQSPLLTVAAAPAGMGLACIAFIAFEFRRPIPGVSAGPSVSGITPAPSPVPTGSETL